MVIGLLLIALLSGMNCSLGFTSESAHSHNSCHEGKAPVKSPVLKSCCHGTALVAPRISLRPQYALSIQMHVVFATGFYGFSPTADLPFQSSDNLAPPLVLRI